MNNFLFNNDFFKLNQNFKFLRQKNVRLLKIAIFDTYVWSENFWLDD